MGDRGNIKVVSSETPEGIYFYSHWGGSELARTLQQGLQRGKGCWDDESYLNRIIFCEMIKMNVMGETGYGISTFECDNEHPILTVDHEKQEVRCNDNTWSFTEFIKHNTKELIDLCIGGNE